MTKERYIKEVVKGLKCSKAKKKEIARQLESDIQIALENGETMESIVESMGTPESMATAFNENLSEAEQAAMKKAKRQRNIAIVIGIVVAICVIAGGIYWWLPKGKMVEESEKFNKEEVQEQAERFIALFDEDNFEELCNLSVQAAQTNEFLEALEGAKAMISSSDWGEFQSFGTIYMAEIEQMGRKYMLVQLNASYENISVSYTITLDEELKLAGFYVR
ncbi:MAG: DUF3887 domain-containing protein [Lachnospiraceae bacterium]|nr:DUF3887 domain-containing protein [Lachnospiraceae bacterium]